MTLRSATYILVFLFILLQYNIWFASNSLLETYKLKRAISSQTSNNQQLIKRNDLINTQISHLQESKQSVEDLAREELGMIKQNETFYQFIQ